MHQTDQISDDTILELIQRQATLEQGFRMLMSKYQERLYWQIRRLVIDHEDANDVLQNCFIKVYKNIRRFEGKSQLYTWLYRIAANEAITFLNKKKKRFSSSIDNEELQLSNTLEADQFFDGDAVQLQLQQALSTLPEKQRTVFNLRYFDELSYKEIADLLNTSVGALKASYHHAVKKIEYYFRQVEI